MHLNNWWWFFKNIYIAVCFIFFRCGFSWRFGLSSCLGYDLLDELHHLEHQQTHSRPEPTWGLRQAGRCHYVWGWPPARLGLRWMSKVSECNWSVGYMKLLLLLFSLKRIVKRYWTTLLKKRCCHAKKIFRTKIQSYAIFIYIWWILLFKVN